MVVWLFNVCLLNNYVLGIGMDSGGRVVCKDGWIFVFRVFKGRKLCKLFLVLLGYIFSSRVVLSILSVWVIRDYLVLFFIW